MIRASGLYKAFGEKHVLQNVSLTLDTGFTCLTGASGSGKTTLMRILLGMLAPDAGSVSGRPERLSCLFQEDRLAETLPVQSNLKLALGRRFEAQTAEAHLRLLGMPGCLRESAGALSGGMKRRVALARAVLAQGDFICMDEPFKGLDADTKALAVAYVKRFCAGKTALIITHDADEIRALAARALRMEALSARA